ncbi:hypothetical protein IE992_28595 [Klebsiella pneumoniae]|uniref:Uncharacterized protein n=1 Tax=Klebsiella pneumoniae TaxID=573 RepID=A0A927DB55_KLEPN|nr:hypothetical protein [Klebsiella pneumoniae]MBD3702783.1 hypothetical protein [Klebsiella pneumoniae]MBD3721741.1 hypothetical protein [Klebsiella pneumoniae]
MVTARGTEGDLYPTDFFRTSGRHRNEVRMFQQPVHQHGLLFGHKAARREAAIQCAGAERFKGKFINHFSAGLEQGVIEVAEDDGLIHR